MKSQCGALNAQPASMKRHCETHCANFPFKNSISAWHESNGKKETVVLEGSQINQLKKSKHDKLAEIGYLNVTVSRPYGSERVGRAVDFH